MTEFHGQNLIEYAVEQIIAGSHLANHTYHFAPVETALAGAGNLAEDRFPFVTADLTLTGFNESEAFADLTVVILDSMPEVGRELSVPAYHAAILAKKNRYQLDLLEIGQILLGKPVGNPRKSFRSYGINGSATLTIQYDLPEDDLPEGRAHRLLQCTMVLPMKGGINELTGTFDPS